MTAPVRRRPRLHFTADDGWINDPYGVTWVDGRYHLFFQTIPGRVTWSPNCHWGHATSPDLVNWTEQPLALVPQEFEQGCWSGSVVAGSDREPMLFYTRVAGEDWGRARIAVARGDASLEQWLTDRDAVVIDGPPPGLGVEALRDPFVFRHDEDWIMILAAGFSDGTGGALQYRSRDLYSWSYDGILCSRLSTPDDEVWTGALWECPQLLRLDGKWVLLISVLSDDVLHYVAAAVGDYDGRKFTPRSWQRLTYGNSAYAMTAFEDHDGRHCVMSWLREEPQNNPELTQRAGAHSVVATLCLDDRDQLSLRPHPHLDDHRAAVRVLHRDGRAVVPVGAGPADAELPARPGVVAEIRQGEEPVATISVDENGARVRIDRAGFRPHDVPLDPQQPLLRILFDVDLLEIFTSAGYGAFRTRPESLGAATTLVVDGADVRVWTYP